jgi:type VI secretion system secreted protein VgrG
MTPQPKSGDIEIGGPCNLTAKTNAAGEGPKIKGDRLELLKVTFKKLLK